MTVVVRLSENLNGVAAVPLREERGRVQQEEQNRNEISVHGNPPKRALKGHVPNSSSLLQRN
jgi:hypothetical protein